MKTLFPKFQRSDAVACGLIALLLAGHAALACNAARRLSVTHDEYWHLPVGLVYWKTGRFKYDNINPPLVRMWAALPLLFQSVPTGPIEVWNDPANHGDAFLDVNSERFHQSFVQGRRMIILLSVLTGVLLAVWAWELFGRGAACITVLLWASSPTALAHGSLVTTDMGAAFFFVATLYSLWKFSQRPSWPRAVWFGVCLGLAQLAKFTSVLLYPLGVLLWFVLRYRNRGVEQPNRRRLLAQWSAALGLSLLLWNAGYLFRGTCTQLGDYNFSSRALRSINLSWLQGVPVPLPRDYLNGFDRQRHIMEGEHPVYLDGAWYVGGVPQYFLMTLVYKLPHTLHLLTLLTLLFVWKPGAEPRLGRMQWFLLLTVVSLVVIASTVNMQLGVRYLLPVLPLLILFAGQSARWMNRRRSPGRTVVLGLLILAVPLSLRHHPHHLAYFNELAGGPEYGRWHLLDSNLDWGQDLDALHDFLAERGITRPTLAYFGTVPPAAAGIDYELPPYNPAAGWHVLSVNFVQGRPHQIRDRDGRRHDIMLEEYGYFRVLEPVAHIGYSIDVYYLSETDLERYFPGAPRE